MIDETALSGVQISVLFYRALRGVTLVIPTNALIQNFILKHLKSLEHVSILRSSSGSHTVPC